MEVQMAMYSMVLNYPVDMQKCTVTQGFGENPQLYRQFIVAGQPLRGHNGVDIGSYGGVPTPIWPVDDGVVKFVGYRSGPNARGTGYDPSGWGNYLDIQHSWGISRYAHLHTINVKNGQRVAAPKSGVTTYLGEMGTTGNSTGVHLHLGIYPTGEPKTNGFGGAIDPAKPINYFMRYVVGTPTLIKEDGLISEETEATTNQMPDPLHAGNASVIYKYGLPLRAGPASHNTIIARLAYGAIIPIGGEYKDIGNVRWRKVELWIGEWQGGDKLLQQL
jgi:hypothetical protein